MEENQKKIEEQQRKMVGRICLSDGAWTNLVFSVQAEERLKMIEEQMKIENEKQKLKKKEEKAAKKEQAAILGKDNSRQKRTFSLNKPIWTHLNYFSFENDVIKCWPRPIMNY